MLVRRIDGINLGGKIVETEAYLGLEDKASHSYLGKKTMRNEPMFMAPGTCYVYQIYGIYTCINISAKEEGAAVLIRALEPTLEIDRQHYNRSLKTKGKRGVKFIDISNGPSKLCHALHIAKDEINKEDLSTSEKIWIDDAYMCIDRNDIISKKRIGINYAEEWVDKPLRFYIKENKNVSVR